MELRQLRYALALAEHGSFTRAAEAVGIAQSPLSRQIAALERELGTPLFDRTSRGVVTTAAGTTFCAHVRQVLDDLDLAADETRRTARGETGELRIGAIGSALTRVLPVLLGDLRARHPRLTLDCTDMSSREGTAALLAGEIDVAVCRGAPSGVGAERLTALALEHDHVVLLCHHAHPFASRPAVTWDQVRGQTLIVTSSGEEPDVLEALAQMVDLTDRGPTTLARDLHTKIGLVACGLGIGTLPAGSAALAPPGTRIVELDPVLALPDLHLVFRTGDGSPAVSTLLTVAAGTFPAVRHHLVARP